MGCSGTRKYLELQLGSQLSHGSPGENVKAFFSRVAALAFEQSVLQELEKRNSTQLQVGDGDLIRAYRHGCMGWGKTGDQ